MGSGLSMSSVNKIKELAAAREYSLALDIIESQDLTKSLNPQFLRTCGEVYTATGRYVDARRTLIMAHRLAPEAKRIIFSLIELYYKMGYFKLAQTYYDIYMFDADLDNLETKQLMYIREKVVNDKPEALEKILDGYYIDNLDYVWSFETFLLYYLLNKKEAVKTLIDDYLATYKNTDYGKMMQSVLNDEVEIRKLFYVYAEQEREDDSEEEEELRELETSLLNADELRIHPPEPEITIMVDDHEEATIGIKRKLKKFIKEQEQIQAEQENEVSGAPEQSPAVYAELSDDSEQQSASDIEKEKNASDVVKRKEGLFSRIFGKKKSREESESIAEENTGTSEYKVENDESQNKVSGELDSEDEAFEKMIDAAFGSEASEKLSASLDATVTEATESENTEIDEAVSEETNPEETQAVEAVSQEIDLEDTATQSIVKTLEDDGMQDRQKIVVSLDLDDGFEAEADSVADFDEAEDTVELSDVKENSISEEEPDNKNNRSMFVFEEVELEPEDDEEEYAVDDFSQISDDGFGYMEETSEDASVPQKFDDIEAEPETEDILENAETEAEAELNPEADEVAEAESEDIADAEVSDDIVEVAEAESEDIADAEGSDDIVEVAEAEPEENADAEGSNDIVEVAEAGSEENADAEGSDDIVEVAEAESEENADAEVSNDIVEVAEAESEDIAELEDITETEEEFEAAVEKVEETDAVDITVTEESEKTENSSYRSVFGFEREKKSSIDFPVFKSSLFPTYHNEKPEVNNNFNQIMDEAQTKLRDNMLKEEQMQREAEALLASLGIDLGDISVDKDEDKVEKTPQPEKQTTMSRDELKASLVIDDNKKNILRKLKEYR